MVLLKNAETFLTFHKTVTLANAVPCIMIPLWMKREDLGNILEMEWHLCLIIVFNLSFINETVSQVSADLAARLEKELACVNIP